MTDLLSTSGRIAGRLSLALASGLLLGLYSRAPQLVFLPYLALVPWVILYTDRRRGKVAFLYYFVAAWLAWVLQYPQPSRNAWFATPLLGLYYLPTWMPFAPVLRRLHFRFDLPRTLTVPLAWVSVEWLRATFSVAKFDLYLIGYSQAPFPLLIQIADVTGVYGVSFLIAAVNGLIADVVFRLRDGGFRWSALRSRRLLWSAGSVFGALVLVAGYGVTRLAGAHDQDGPRVAIVQPCTSHIPGNAIGDHLQQVLITHRGVPAGAADLVVWPENAVFDNIRREGVYLEDLGWLASDRGAPMLVGGMEWPLDRPGKKINTAFLIGTDGRILAQYGKQLLFPYTEYIPLDTILEKMSPSLQRLQRKLIRQSWGAAARAVPGDGMQLFHLPWGDGTIPFAALICSENTYPPLPAEAGRMGARFFVNITSEGNLGAPVQEQLVRICKLRAVENRIAYVRVGNTGISCFIDAQGRTRGVVRGPRGRAIQEVGVLVAEVPLSEGGVTAYARSRDAFVLLCVLATGVLLVGRFSGRIVPILAVSAILSLGPACVGPPPIGTDAAAANDALARGRQAFDSGRIGVAITEMALACADVEACRTALVYAEECYRRTNEVEVAAEFFGEIAAAHPSLAAEALGIRGDFLDRAGDPDEAEREYRRSVEVAPTAWVWESLGRLLLRRQEIDGALEAHREAVRLSPRDVALRVRLARALRIAGERDEARAIVDEALGLDPALATAWQELGWLHLAGGEAAEAEGAFRRAIREDPDDIESRLLLARIVLREGRVDDAERRLVEIQRIQSDRFRARRDPRRPVARTGAVP